MKTPAMYTVMQYNILHQKKGWSSDEHLVPGLLVRSQGVARAIKENAPDILVLAERHDEWAGIPISNNGYEIDEGVSVDLTALLDRKYVFVEDRIEGGKTVNRTPIVYNADRFRCLESGSYELGEEHSFDRSQNKRVVSYAVLEDITDTDSNGVRIVVFATHWSSGQPQSLINTQSESMQTIMRNVLSQKDYARLPVIAAADYNVLYPNEAYQSLLSGMKMIDADAAVNNEAVDQSIVDHIAIAGCTVVSFSKSYADYISVASDHAPISCQIKIGG